MSTNAWAGHIQLLQGTLHLLTLRTCLLGPMHGHAIAKAIERNSEDVLQGERKSFYPELHRLIKRRSISAEEGTSENNRPALPPADGQRSKATFPRDQQIGQTGGGHRALHPSKEEAKP